MPAPWWTTLIVPFRLHFALLRLTWTLWMILTRFLLCICSVLNKRSCSYSLPPLPSLSCSGGLLPRRQQATSVRLLRWPATFVLHAQRIGEVGTPPAAATANRIWGLLRPSAAAATPAAAAAAVLPERQRGQRGGSPQVAVDSQFAHHWSNTATVSAWGMCPTTVHLIL